MVSSKIRKIMTGAMLRFAEREKVGVQSIGMFIHSKLEDCSPQYFYTVEGKVKKNEDGTVQDLDFVSDILGKKMDMFGQQYLASSFLKGYIKGVAEEHNVSHKTIYVQIATADDNAANLHLALLTQGTKLKDLTLEEIFND